RITMLSQQYQDDLTGDDFKHQPWDQTIKILAASGYVRQAEDIAIAKENALWAGGVRNMPSFLHYLWGYCVGFGYRPLRLLWALPIIWLLSIPLYLAAANANLMAPTDDKILSDPAFDMCKPAHGGNWTACALAPNYPDFQVMGYALSLLIPAIDTRLGHSWAPSDWSMTLPRRPSALGLAAIIWSWIEGIFALAAPALIAGVFTGITKRSLPGQAR
ncbi:MAG TPA: hypothetical protein PLC74_14150, partial [Acetobacteraceae bacterium]|nr:hypothetical protein [Acetobacteraceae bacterium]